MKKSYVAVYYLPKGQETTITVQAKNEKDAIRIAKSIIAKEASVKKSVISMSILEEQWRGDDTKTLKQKEDIWDALNFLDEMADTATEDTKEKKQIEKAYDIVSKFLEKNL